MPRVWTEEQKAAAAETRRRNKEAKSSYEKVFPSDPNYNESKEFGISPAMEAVKSEQERAIEEAPITHTTTMQVTYRPFDGDPHTMVWNGITFHANVPVELDRSNRAHHYDVPEATYVVNPSTGRRQFNHTEVSKFMGDMARGNPSFEVDGERAKRLVNKRILPPAGHGFAEDHADEIVEWR